MHQRSLAKKIGQNWKNFAKKSFEIFCIIFFNFFGQIFWCSVLIKYFFHEIFSTFRKSDVSESLFTRICVRYCSACCCVILLLVSQISAERVYQELNLFWREEEGEKKITFSLSRCCCFKWIFLRKKPRKRGKRERWWSRWWWSWSLNYCIAHLYGNIHLPRVVVMKFPWKKEKKKKNVGHSAKWAPRRGNPPRKSFIFIPAPYDQPAKAIRIRHSHRESWSSSLSIIDDDNCANWLFSPHPFTHYYWFEILAPQFTRFWLPKTDTHRLCV